MENYSEKRQHERQDCKTPAYLYRYDTQDSYYDAGAYYDADMYNYSEGGGYLQTNEKIDVGQQVYVKIKNYHKTSEGPEKYETYAGYVRWSNELGTSSPGGQYGYGIEYKAPVYY
jgi:Tfp pilus assembly protein PilZ